MARRPQSPTPLPLSLPTPLSRQPLSPTLSGSSASVGSSGSSGGASSTHGSVRQGSAAVLAMYQQPLEDLENAVKAIFIADASNVELGKDLLLNLLRSMRSALEAVDDAGGGKEVAQTAVAAFRRKAEVVARSDHADVLDQIQAAYLAAVKDVRTHTYNILGDLLCMPTSPIHHKPDTATKQEQLVFERLRTQAQLKALAEESWRKANEVARSSDQRKQRERLNEWDRQMRIKSLNNLAMEDPAAHLSEDDDSDHGHGVRPTKPRSSGVHATVLAAAYQKDHTIAAGRLSAIASVPNLAEMARSTPQPPALVSSVPLGRGLSTSTNGAGGSMPGKMNELEQSFVRSRLSQYQGSPSEDKHASSTRAGSKPLNKGRSLNDFRTELATSADINTRFVVPSSDPTRSTLAGASLHPGRGREVWVPFQHDMVLYDGHMPVGRCIVCRHRVLPVPKPLRCRHCEMYCHADCHDISVVGNIDCQRQ